MSQPFVGQIFLVGFNFAPRGFAFCQGQLLPIAQNAALFSLLGTTYGGNGTTNFALPDLRGRVPIGFGQGPGLQNYAEGQIGGAEAPSVGQHTHTAALNAANVVASTAKPDATVLLGHPKDNASPPVSAPVIYTPAAGATVAPLAPNAVVVANAGVAGGQGNLPPYLAMNYVIALNGIFPSRN